MCGINGFNWNDEKLARAMNNSIRHRGPDDEGYYFSPDVSFGHLRLSIIDLTKGGHQPMGLAKGKQITDDKKLSQADLIIAFNGEIYNYLDVKSELEEKNVKFQSESDTEVILRSYEMWGEKCVKKFNGMWSFCIHDKKKKVLFCSRDRLGVKPFNYFYDGKRFVFSSEIKAILKANVPHRMRNDALQLYFSLGYIPAPMTVYENIFKLEGGHNLTFDLKTKKVKLSKYYELPVFRPVHDRKKLVSEGRKILLDATRLRMISDVPVGAFLSGGLDSSSVVGTMSKFTKLENLHTFSIGFEKKYDKGRYDETKYVEIVRKFYGTKHHHYYFTEKDFMGLLDKYSFAYDEPFSDYSGFPTLKISELARKHVTVVLSGDGGDEIFGGYTSHLMGSRLDTMRKIPAFMRKIFARTRFKRNLNKTSSMYLLKEAFGLSLMPKDSFYAASLVSETYKPKIYKEWTTEKLRYALKLGGNKQEEALRIYDLLFNTLQNNFLVKVDRASMQAPIEVRSPFLDYRFAELGQKIPAEWKCDARKTKILMREIIKDIVPKEIVNRNKQGFEPPLDKWIQTPKYEEYMKKNIFRLKKIDHDLHEFYTTKVMKDNNKFYNIYRIRLFLYLKWLERWT